MIETKVGPFLIQLSEFPTKNEGSLSIQFENTFTKEKGQEQVEYRLDELNEIWIKISTGERKWIILGKEEEFELRTLFSNRRFSQLKLIRGQEDQISNQSKNKQRSLQIKSQMPGKIVRIAVKQGEVIQKNQSLLVMEAMKMENEIRSPRDGVVSQVFVSEGQAVENGVPLIALE